MAPFRARNITAVILWSCLATPSRAGNWLTYAGSAQRLGYNGSETALTAATVPNLKLHWKTLVTAWTAGQPLYMEQVITANGAHDEVFVTTVRGQVEALNAATGKLDWTAQLPVSQAQSGSCVTADIGIEGTPTIDPVTRLMYVVDGAGALHALAIATGAEAPGYPVQVIDPIDLANGSFNHSSPTLAGGVLYITTSGTGSCEAVLAPYHGLVIAFDTQTLAVTSNFSAVNSKEGGGGIWGPGGALYDAVTGYLFVGTGNALVPNSGRKLSLSVVALSPTLQKVGADSPGLPEINPKADVDFASTPTPIDLPHCPPLMSVMNKNGNLFLYKRAHVGQGPTQVWPFSQGNGNSAFIGMAAYDASKQLLFINNPIASKDGSVTNGGVALTIASHVCTLSVAWQTAYGTGDYANTTRATDPTVAGGVVWFVTGAGDSVLALDELTGAPLWSSGSAMASPTVTPVTVMDGQMFVQSGAVLYAYGL